MCQDGEAQALRVGGLREWSEDYKFSSRSRGWRELKARNRQRVARCSLKEAARAVHLNTSDEFCQDGKCEADLKRQPPGRVSRLSTDVVGVQWFLCAVLM